MRTALLRVFALLAAACALALGIAHAAPVAMVSDLQGKGTLVAGAARTPLAMLAEIEANAQVELETGARLVALYLDGSGEYVVTGPAVVAFRSREPHAVKGAAPQRRSVLGGKAGADVKLKPVGAVQGALVMRSATPKGRIRLVNPSGTRILEASPEFRWHFDAANLTYRFELLDETGTVLFETDQPGTSVKLPASVKLAENVPYTWTVSARLPDGRKYSSSGDFSIAPAAMRRQVASLAPGAAAPVSDRVAYAAWLEQLELKDEARKVWRALAAERPDDRKLEALARD